MTELDELDKLAAEKVMGWEHPATLGMQMVIHDFHPTRDIAQAWKCLENTIKDYSGVHDSFVATGRLDSPADGYWYCALDREDGRIQCEAQTASEAIVRACLKAKGVEIG